MPPIDDAVVELLLAERAIRGLGTLRFALSHNERLRIGEMLRDAADAVDHGQGTMVIEELEQFNKAMGRTVPRGTDRDNHDHGFEQAPPESCPAARAIVGPKRLSRSRPPSRRKASTTGPACAPAKGSG